MLTILIKFITGKQNEVINEIWFLALLVVVLLIILAIPNISKPRKLSVYYLVTSMLIVFFGLGALGFVTKYIIIDFTDMDSLSRFPYIAMLVVLCGQLLVILIHKTRQRT